MLNPTSEFASLLLDPLPSPYLPPFTHALQGRGFNVLPNASQPFIMVVFPYLTTSRQKSGRIFPSTHSQPKT